ncbi:MAG TPA: hypothetical protein VGL63_15945 [Streptosporangiaceae bacterium]|jgi:hypothetical protein
MMTTERTRLTEPLRTVTTVFGGLLLLGLIAVVVFTVFGSGSLGGFGHGTICATQPNTTYGGSGWTDHLGIATRPGTSISINGTLQACADRPGIGQRVLYTLTSLPGQLVWIGVIALLWLVIGTADRAGPFTGPVAMALQRLGWFIIVGSIGAAVVQGFALDQLLNTMLRGDHVGDPLTAAIHVLPVPVLAGVALLTFARIIRAGADMQDEIRGTV